MRLPLVFALVALAVNLAVDLYIFRRLRGHRLTSRIHAGLSIVLAALWTGIICVPKRMGDDAFLLRLMWAIYAYWSVYIPKYVFIIADLAASAPRLWHRRRLRWLSAPGIAGGCAVFCLMWWGALVERFRIDVREVPVYVADLPADMEGLRIVQISDWHVGSYGQDAAYIRRCIDRIDGLHPDVVVFTGDIVNRHSDELRPFVRDLAALRAPMGVYSVMGNHDYGDYFKWSDERAHRADADSLRAMQRRMGWKMLDNSTVMLRRGRDSIALIGVENIGEPPFTTRGDLLRAYPTPSDSTTKVLLSHNPTHWTDSIAGNPDMNIALTLSGHTHAMQMRAGRFSPAAWRYPTWGGLYSDNTGHSLYVNIGLGTVGIPMRLGATPEITVITLHDKE